MRRIIRRLRESYWRLRMFLVRYGLRSVPLEAARRLGLNSLADRLLCRVVPTFRAWQVLADTPAQSVAGLKVSVVIPVYNGVADGLERLLLSLQRQSHRNLEIIAVDSGSTDQSVALLEQHGVKVVKIAKEQFRHDYARNLGAEQAGGDYLLFTVCDCCFDDPEWIAIGLRQLRHFRAASYSTPQSYDEQAEPYARYLAYNFVAANGYRLGVNIFGNRWFGRAAFAVAGRQSRERVIHADDTNHLVRRDFFQKHRYTTHTCEDMSFGTKIIRNGERFIYSTLSQVQHYHRYGDYKRYFSRVLVDLVLINDILNPYRPRPCHGAVDAAVDSAAMILGAVLRTLRFFGDANVKKLALRATSRNPEIVPRRA